MKPSADALKPMRISRSFIIVPPCCGPGGAERVAVISHREWSDRQRYEPVVVFAHGRMDWASTARSMKVAWKSTIRATLGLRLPMFSQVYGVLKAASRIIHNQLQVLRDVCSLWLFDRLHIASVTTWRNARLSPTCAGSRFSALRRE